MKQRDVQIGEVYIAMVSGELVPVRVVREAAIVERGLYDGSPCGSVRTRKGYILAHASEPMRPGLGTKTLPKPRTAAALRPMPTIDVKG